MRNAFKDNYTEKGMDKWYMHDPLAQQLERELPCTAQPHAINASFALRDKAVSEIRRAVYTSAKSAYQAVDILEQINGTGQVVVTTKQFLQEHTDTKSIDSSVQEFQEKCLQQQQDIKTLHTMYQSIENIYIQCGQETVKLSDLSSNRTNALNK